MEKFRQIQGHLEGNIGGFRDNLRDYRGFKATLKEI
jgi:hypothetical protein